MDRPSHSHPYTAPPRGGGGRDSLSIAEAAALVNLSRTTLRRYIKAGQLKASPATGKYGKEYRIHPSVLKVFALETLNLTLRVEDLEGVEEVGYTQAVQPPPPEYTALYERLLEATAEATRYKTLTELSESTLRQQENEYREQIARLEFEKRDAEREKQALEERLAALEGRGLWARIFGKGR